MSQASAKAFEDVLKAFLIELIMDKEVEMTGHDCLKTLMKNTFSHHD